MMVRRATIGDLDELVVLFDLYRAFYERESDLNSTRNFLAERISRNDSVVFVAQSLDGALMGFVQLYPLFSSLAMKRLWLLNDLYVKHEFRGLNVSVELIELAKQLAIDTGSAGLMLETAKTNTVGNNLYRKTDFVLDADHNYYFWSDKS